MSSAIAFEQTIAEYENIHFNYQNVNEPEKISENQYIVVYSNNTINTISNKLAEYNGNNIEQISISFETFYENNDGTFAIIINSNNIERNYIAEYANVSFMYNEMIVETISENHIVRVYNDITIISSDNTNFKKGDAIQQLSVSIQFFLEKEDGTQLN
jgi:hypothetical protein